MVRKIVILFSVLLLGNVYAQDSTNKFRYQSVLKGTATICPGISLNNPQTNIYINGDLEYFPEEHVSLRGEVFWFVGAQQKPALLQQNSCMMFGALYHFHKNRLDYFVGLETGASLTKPNDTNYDISFSHIPITVTPTSIISYDYKILPLISPVTGITFYVSDYFNFFLNARYVKANYFGYTNGKTLSLDEIRISAGLGFQIHLKKKK